MQDAETVLGILRERGRKGLPCEELYRQLFNPQLYLLAYGRIYANHGAMTAGASQETADGMSTEKIGAIIEAMRHERYRFTPVRRVFIPKRNGKMRPLGMPTWSDKLVGEVVRLLLEAYYEPQFSDRSHGFRPGRGCHTALREVQDTWTGTTWFIEGDISDCFGSLNHEIMVRILSEKIRDNRFLRLIRNMLKAALLLFMWVGSGALRRVRGRSSQVKGAWRRRCREGAARPPGPASLCGPFGQGLRAGRGLPVGVRSAPEPQPGGWPPGEDRGMTGARRPVFGFWPSTTRDEDGDGRARDEGMAAGARGRAHSDRIGGAGDRRARPGAAGGPGAGQGRGGAALLALPAALPGL